MLRRIYIDNYKACDNFELEMDSINLLLGDNGVGKSTILEVIEKLRTLLSESIESNESRSAGRLFSHKSLTKWQKQSQQTFELDIESSEGLYKYSLVIDHNLDFSGSEKPATRVARERLRLDEKILLEVEFGQAKLFDDDGNKRAEAMFDWAVSAIPIVRADYNNKQLQKFRELIRNIIVFQVNASSIDSQFEGESSKLDRQARNFAQWYRSMSSDQGFAYDATSIFRDILEGFDSFEYTKYSEENYQLEVKFRIQKVILRNIASMNCLMVNVLYLFFIQY